MNENHLDVYEDRSELHNQNQCLTFVEGLQSPAAKKRYNDICSALKAGYLSNLLDDVKAGKIDFSTIPSATADDIRGIVKSISADSGRALAILIFIQLTVKSICPEQCIRLHKGSSNKKKNEFSWQEGISLRSLDKRFVSKFLRDSDLLTINKDGAMMTRTLAENYPYTELYKASIAGPVDEWLRLVDGAEDEAYPVRETLGFLIALLMNRSIAFKKLSDMVEAQVSAFGDISLNDAKNLFAAFISRTSSIARAFEVVLHSFIQAIGDVGGLPAEKTLRPLSQMRTANKKAGNIGDIEIEENGVVVEAWDAKFGKSYLYDELQEIEEKLQQNPDARIAGFVTDSAPMMKNDVIDKKTEIGKATGTQVEIFSFDQWVQFQAGDLDADQKTKIGRAWLVAATQSFGRKRLSVAPIEEPCDGWLSDMLQTMKDYLLKLKH